MNKFARPDNFGHPIRNPLIREHFVYRAFNDEGELLYVGCSARIEARINAHRTQADWWPAMSSLRVAGPYNYETARDLERTAIHTERPLYNMTPERRLVMNAHHRVVERMWHSLGGQVDGTITAASEHAERVIGYPGNRAPFRITDLTVPAALRAEKADAATYERRTA